MWELPRTGMEPVSPTLAGGFLTTALPGKSHPSLFLKDPRYIHSWNCTLGKDLRNYLVTHIMKKFFKSRLYSLKWVIPQSLLKGESLSFNESNSILMIFFFNLFMAVLGLRFCARAFSSCGKRGPLFIAVRGPLTVAASLVAEHRLQMRRLSSCGSRA